MLPGDERAIGVRVAVPMMGILGVLGFRLKINIYKWEILVIF